MDGGGMVGNKFIDTDIYHFFFLTLEDEQRMLGPIIPIYFVSNSQEEDIFSHKLQYSYEP